MADPLRRYIHHETQEPGSMLCAAHALNNLVQADHFDPSTLAELGKQLDELEHSYRSEGSGSSRAGAVNGRTNGIGRRVEDEDHDGRKGHYGNYDDSGFFSLAVMERALGNFGLRLVRWRSEEMRAEHDRPESVLTSFFQRVPALAHFWIARFTKLALFPAGTRKRSS